MPRTTKPAALDLSTPHGYRSRSASGQEWVEPRFRAALALDYLAAEEVVARASLGVLQDIVRLQGRRLREGREALESQAMLCILAAWWPQREMPVETAADRGFTYAKAA
jgi:hypothetical protein